MDVCFVIQPFGGRNDKLYDEVFDPAIRGAGLEPYRVDRDPTVVIPIESIENEIAKAAFCLADITTNNPNVWYEMGYALASKRRMILVCNSEMRGAIAYPFDIKHRFVIDFLSHGPSDFDKLRNSIVERISAQVRSSDLIAASSVPVVNPTSIKDLDVENQNTRFSNLSEIEIALIASISSFLTLPEESVMAATAKREMERQNLGAMAYPLAIKKLKQIDYISVGYDDDDGRAELYPVLSLTEKGWEWIEQHSHLFFKLPIPATPQREDDDDIPF